MDETSYFTHRYQLDNDCFDCDDGAMSFDYLLQIMNNLTITNDEFLEILSKAGWQVVHDEQCGILINLKPLLILSSSVPDDFDALQENIEEMHRQTDDNTIKNGEWNEEIINEDDEKLIDNTASEININNNLPVANFDGFNRSIGLVRSNHDDGVEWNGAHHDLESNCNIDLKSPLTENSLLRRQNIRR